MKFVVDKLPDKCEECEYCAAAMAQSPLGVAKPVNLYTLQTLAVTQASNQEINFIDPEESPLKNYCPCTDNRSGIIVDANIVDSELAKGSIIL